jgi:DNA polymerase
MNSIDKEIRELLAFYVDAGADVVIGEQPIDRMADEPATPAAAAPRNEIVQSRPDGEPPKAQRNPILDRYPQSARTVAGTAASPAVAPPPPDVAAMAAREAAKSANTLDDLRALLDNFQGCGLRATATQLAFADGNPQARVMFVGEAPGYEEDKTGKPFVGRSGKLLDRMMEAIGLDRTKAYIANVVPWRPPGNRTPTPQETAICLPFVRRQIELADPDILVCLGQPATQTLLGTKEGITRTRGRWFKFDTGRREIRAIATLHPAYLLRQPLQKRLAWRDFLAIKKALAE